jgi:membrane-associated phospholipid phosphatase
MTTDVPAGSAGFSSRALDATRGARTVVGWYLRLTALVLLFAGAPFGGTALHVGLVLLVTIAERAARRRPGMIAAAVAWLPLLLLPVLYAELPLVIAAGGSPFRDQMVQGWERLAFGAPARTLAASLPSVALSEVLHLGYLSYYPLIYLPPLLLWLRRRDDAFGETLLALAVTFTACFAVYALFPVQGPRYLWSAGAPEGPVRSIVVSLLERGSSRGAAFPSSHMAVAVTQAVVALRLQPRVGMVAAVSAGLIGVGAVYGGFHYAIDMAAGAALGAVVAMAVRARRAVLARPALEVS